MFGEACARKDHVSPLYSDDKFACRSIKVLFFPTLHINNAFLTRRECIRTKGDNLVNLSENIMYYVLFLACYGEGYSEDWMDREQALAWTRPNSSSCTGNYAYQAEPVYVEKERADSQAYLSFFRKGEISDVPVGIHYDNLWN
jgi:hypothetical protein